MRSQPNCFEVVVVTDGVVVVVVIAEMSETLVSRLRLRPGWSQSRSQALRPKHQNLSISLSF